MIWFNKKKSVEEPFLMEIEERDYSGNYRVANIVNKATSKYKLQREVFHTTSINGKQLESYSEWLDVFDDGTDKYSFTDVVVDIPLFNSFEEAVNFKNLIEKLPTYESVDINPVFSVGDIVRTLTRDCSKFPKGTELTVYKLPFFGAGHYICGDGKNSHAIYPRYLELVKKKN